MKEASGIGGGKAKEYTYCPHCRTAVAGLPPGGVGVATTVDRVEEDVVVVVREVVVERELVVVVGLVVVVVVVVVVVDDEVDTTGLEEVMNVVVVRDVDCVEVVGTADVVVGGTGADPPLTSAACTALR